MSVALPVVSVVFGSVTPPQGDIIDLRVHLGCLTEISSFECLLQNFDEKYSPDGTYPINVGDDAAISLGRSSNCPSILTGKVEEIEPLSSANENYIRVKGRCSGEQLFRRLVTKSWDNVKGEVVVRYLIDNYTSLSHVRGGSELIEDTDTTYTRLDYEDTPVFDIIKYIAETADKAGVIGYDFRVAPDGKFEFFPKNSKTSSVSLSERLEVSEYAKNIHRIRNKITVYGNASGDGRCEPSNKDEWTVDDIANWIQDNGVWTADTGTVKVGSNSLKGDTNGTANAKCHRNFSTPFSAVGNRGYKTLNFYAMVSTANILFQRVRLYAPDANNHFHMDIAYPIGSTLWHFRQFQLGPNGGWESYGNPDWSNIQGIEFDIGYTVPVSYPNFFDGLYFGGGRYRATREDSASQTQYGLREKVETDEELYSDAECDYRAKALLDFLKGPIETLKVRSEVIDYGTTPILAGDKIHVTIPNENIDADYRIISAEYKASGGDQTLEVELELAKEPQLLADFIYGFRKAIQKLDKYKASSSAGGVSSGGSGGGGGGGGGMAQHANEYHDPDMAFQSDFASHKTRHENGGADEINVAGLSGELADPQPPKAHTLASHSSKNHSELTGVTSDQHHAQLHKDSHKSGGEDAFTVSDLLDAVARVTLRKNTGANIGSRRRLNFIEGDNVELTVVDDPTDEEVDVTFDVNTQLSFLKTGRYYRSIMSTYNMFTGALPLMDNLRATCYPITRKMTFDEIAIQLYSGESGKKVRLGIYDDYNGTPNNLILDCGEVDASTSGLKTIALSPALQLNTGIYWLAFVTNSSVVSVYRQSGYMNTLLGHDTSLILSYGSNYRAYAYGALPDPFGAVTISDILWAVGLKLQSVP